MANEKNAAAKWQTPSETADNQSPLIASRQAGDSRAMEERDFEDRDLAQRRNPRSIRPCRSILGSTCLSAFHRPWSRFETLNLD